MYAILRTYIDIKLNSMLTTKNTVLQSVTQLSVRYETEKKRHLKQPVSVMLWKSLGKLFHDRRPVNDKTRCVRSHSLMYWQVDSEWRFAERWLLLAAGPTRSLSYDGRLPVCTICIRRHSLHYVVLCLRPSGVIVIAAVAGQWADKCSTRPAACMERHNVC